MTLLSSALVTVLTALTSLLLTPFDFFVAKKLGAIDMPKDGRRMHKLPIPRLGGLSVFASALLFTLTFCFDTAFSLFFAWAGAILLVTVGILDDILALPPAVKLIAQFGAAYVSTLGGTIITQFGKISLGAASLPVTLLWIVTLINAHNFIDGLDGLCGSVCIAESGVLGLLLLKSGQLTLALAAFTLLGACIGFLPYNLNGARIFMGDCGSTFLGFALSWLSVAALSTTAPRAPYAILLLFFVPLADLIVAVARRVAKGKNPFLPDRSHIHHLLADTKLGHFGASRLLRLAAALFAAVGYFIA